MASKGLRWFKIVFCSMLLGGLWRLNEHNTWMSVREMRVNAANPVLEERYWAVLPSRYLRFWPLFMRRAQALALFFEKTNPVLVETRMTGLGSFVTDIKLLSPIMIVEWKGELWCVSKEGRMWNIADRSLWFRDLNLPLKPVWRLQALPFVAEGNLPLPSGVFPSIFSTDAIDEFLKGLGGASWFGGVEEVTLDRRAGDDLFRLRYNRKEQNFMILIQRNKYRWEELSLALEHILDHLARENGDRLIDATYTDKILVRDLPVGAIEGSSRQ